MNVTPRLRGPARLMFGNPVSLVYLALVVAAVLFAVVDTAFVQHEDASFAGIWAALLTAPTVFPMWLAGDALWGGTGSPQWYLILTLAVAALVNALLLGLVHRGLRGRPSTRGAIVSGGWHTQRHGDH
ncbi:SCO4225 family membrane protein [Streptomyces sp. NPDC059788]|uniref:SCO4225 family membrane protein n=1 Tax=Streptomyces sp. NPDC059788 TaxID=3346948 RepID=UPI00366621FA